MPATPDDLFQHLDALGIAHETTQHQPVFTVAESQALRGTLPGGHSKNLFLKNKKGDLWLVTAAEDAAVDLKALTKTLGAGRLSFGKPDLLLEVLGVEPGSVTPFGLINDPNRRVTFVLDTRLAAIMEPLHFHPLVNNATTAISTADFRAFLAAAGHTVIDSGGAMVEAALAEAGALVDVKPVDIRTNAQRDPAYLAINPHGKLPALVTPEGGLLTETLAILLTLDDRHPEAGLLPPRPSPDREKALRWLTFAATELYPIVKILDYPNRFTAAPENTNGTRETALEIWCARLHTMEAQLTDAGPYLLGGTFCLTDIYWAVVSRWGFQPGWTAAHTPRLERLFHAVCARPKIAAAWGDRWEARPPPLNA